MPSLEVQHESIICKNAQACWLEAVMAKLAPIQKYVRTHTILDDAALDTPDKFKSPRPVFISSHAKENPDELVALLRSAFCVESRSFYGIGSNLEVDGFSDQISVNTWLGNQSLGFRFTALCVDLGIATLSKSHNGITQLHFRESFKAALPKHEYEPVKAPQYYSGSAGKARNAVIFTAVAA